MSLHIVPLDHSLFPAWIERSANEYAADLESLGSDPDEALLAARASLQDAFPEGHPTAQNAVFVLTDDDLEVGYVWVGLDTSDDPAAWWVWDIVIDPAFRGHGFGRTGMQLAEEYARSQGAATLGLSVFGFNTAARGLYESLGYETTSIKMRKRLSPGQPE